MNSRVLREMRSAVENARYLCLFGIGVLLEECFRQITLSLGRIPDFLCDNSREKWGAAFWGVKCISPQELEKLRMETAVVITARNYEGIYRQLQGMEIKDIFVSCYDRSYNALRAIKKLEEGASQSRRPISVKGKWTVVTGASRGVGRQIALEMARLGSNIVAHSRSASHVREVEEACSGFGVGFVPVAADLSDSEQLEAMLAELKRFVPQVDILFNNAAIACPPDFWSASGQEFLTCYAVNTVAPIRLCQEVIPGMIRRGYGRVINVTSSVQNRPETMAYACSKAALDKFVHDLVPSLKSTGVLLTLVDPGWLRTDMTGHEGLHAVESVIPGVLMGALCGEDMNGCWFSAQDYAGLTIPEAVGKANFLLG